MKPVRLLIADNLPEALAVYAEIFERAGYRVIRASSYEEAKAALENSYLHVAVLDLRLRRNPDRTDISGLDLARRSSPAIAKIILTSFGDGKISRDALAPDSSGERAAVSYVKKAERKRVLLDHVARAVKTLRIHRELNINWIAVDRSSLVESFLPGDVQRGHLDDRVEEIEDLVGRLFPTASVVRLERILWHEPERAALLARAVFASGVIKFFVIILGLRDPVSAEAMKFHSLGLDSSWPGVPLLERNEESIRFAANLFIFSGLDLTDCHGLAEVFRSAPEKTLMLAMQHLFEQVLPPWHRTSLPEAESVRTSWANRSRVAIRADLFEKAVGAIQGRIHGLGIELEIVGTLLQTWIKGTKYVFPGPASWLSDQPEDKPVPLYLLPGILDGRNILVDSHGRVALTNFGEVGGGSLLSPFLEIEASIRFDWHDERDLDSLIKTARLLTEGNFSRPVGDAEPAERRTLKTVLLVRRYAESILSVRWTDWHFGLLFEIARRLALDLGQESLPVDALWLKRQAHLVIAAGLIARQMADNKFQRKAPRTLEIDKSSQAVIVQGTRVPLTQQNFRLLNCLYDCGNFVCSPEVLVRRGLDENYYDESDEHQKTRLSTAIHRLREKIEHNPEQPRFIRKEGAGYRLYRDPTK